MNLLGISARDIAQPMNVNFYRVKHIISGMRNRLAAYNPMKQEG